MKCRTSIVAAAVLAAGLAQPFAAFADTKTVIEETPGEYKETREGDGVKSELQINRDDGSQVYKDSTGVKIKEKIEDGKIKQEIRDGDCKKSVQQDLVTGDSKVVEEGDCKP